MTDLKLKKIGFKVVFYPIFLCKTECIMYKKAQKYTKFIQKSMQTG